MSVCLSVCLYVCMYVCMYALDDAVLDRSSKVKLGSRRRAIAIVAKECSRRGTCKSTLV